LAEVALPLIMNKKIITFIVMLLLIAGISLAAFLDYYGIIIGTAEVKRPHFYIGSINKEELLFDEKPQNCMNFFLENSNTRTFTTKESSERINFDYLPKAKFFLRGNVVPAATTISETLTLKFGYINSNNQISNICVTDVQVTNERKNYISELVNCMEKPKNAKKFYYEFTGNCEDCKYLIQKCAGDFYTKVELSK